MPATPPSAAHAQPSTDLTGSTIGRYYVRSLLGSGGQGEVYCADDLKLNRTVALKRLSPLLRSDERYRQRFLREAQRASGLNDAHIAGIYDVLEHQGELLLVMEYVEGVSLRQRLRERLEPGDFLRVAIQACEALIAAHESGVVHRDIKPENIMLTRTGRLKVLDFGVAKRLPAEGESAGMESTETKAGEISGTPAYMAPELLLHSESDERADIFSLGVVFYELLTGQHPFLAPGLVATVDRILHEKPRSIAELNASVPAALEQIVFKMLAKSPAARYSSAGELLTDLRKLPAAPAGRSQSLFRKLRKHRVGVLSGIAIVIVLVAFSLSRQRWGMNSSIFAERDWVLIADPENTTGQPIFNDSLREALTIALQQSQYVNVLPRARIFEALERMKRADAGRVDENLGRELCQRENVRVLLASSIRSSGEALQITVRAVRPDSGDLLFAESEQLKNKEEFFERVDALAKRVRNNLGESGARVQASSKPLDKVTTQSLEALQLYSEAVNATAKGDLEHVPILLQSALKLDPDFAIAHLTLGNYYYATSGKTQNSVAELKRAYELRQGLTQREQLIIEASYYTVLEQYEREVQALSVLVSLYPDDANAHRQLALAYYDVNQLSKAIAHMREALKLNPFSEPIYGKLVLFLARNNEPRAALEAYEQARKNGVDSGYLHWAIGLAYFGQDSLSDARKEFQRVTATRSFESLGDMYLGKVDLYQGKFSAGLNRLEAGLEADKASNRQGFELARRYLLARTYELLGHRAEARKQAIAMLAAPRSSLQAVHLLWAGTILAQTGDIGGSVKVLRLLDNSRKAHPSAWNNSTFRNLEGEIALSRGNPKQAIAAFEAAYSESAQASSQIGLARAYEQQKDWSQAAAQWQKVLDMRGEILQDYYPLELPAANLGLGRAKVRLQDFAAARIYYEHFLTTVQDSDDFPLRQQALQERRVLKDRLQFRPH